MQEKTRTFWILNVDIIPVIYSLQLTIAHSVLCMANETLNSLWEQSGKTAGQEEIPLWPKWLPALPLNVGTIFSFVIGV